FARLLLNYDLVLVALLADGLSAEDGGTAPERCIMSPLRARPIAGSTEGLLLAADSLVLLSYHKLRDNLHDEQLGKKLLCAAALPFYRLQYQRAASKRPELAAQISDAIAKQNALEAAHCHNADEAAEPTGMMLSALFGTCGKTESERATASRLGLFLGRIIYLLDAAADFESDAKHNSYNVYIESGLSRDDAIQQAREQCNMCAGEATLCYNLLQMQRHKEIMDNVIYLGLVQAIVRIGCQTKRRTQDERPL
ncbi:MAG: DUF5685 family protein, partial [Pygmaiobacter sp.]